MAFNLGNAFANLLSVPAGIGRIGFGGMRALGRGITGIGAGLAAGFGPGPMASTASGREPFAASTTRSGDAGGGSVTLASYRRPTSTASPAEFLAPPSRNQGGGGAMTAEWNGQGWRALDATRDLVGPSTKAARQISLDFNDASNASARGVEIVIPDDASPAERAAAQAYVERTQAFFADHGVDVPVRGVKTRSENGRGTTGRFHTEPFFVRDAAAREVMRKHPDAYAKVLAETLGTIPGATFIAPHTSTDPGATFGDMNERDFARQQILPHLMKLQPRPGRVANPPELMQMQPRGAGALPGPAMNPFLVPPSI